MVVRCRTLVGLIKSTRQPFSVTCRVSMEIWASVTPVCGRSAGSWCGAPLNADYWARLEMDEGITEWLNCQKEIIFYFYQTRFNCGSMEHKFTVESYSAQYTSNLTINTKNDKRTVHHRIPPTTDHASRVWCLSLDLEDMSRSVCRGGERGKSKECGVMGGWRTEW